MSPFGSIPWHRPRRKRCSLSWIRHDKHAVEGTSSHSSPASQRPRIRKAFPCEWSASPGSRVTHASSRRWPPSWASISNADPSPPK
eukprot:10158226-Prorocentrum_lima.AAC.1